MEKRDEIAFVAKVTGYQHTKQYGKETTSISLQHGGYELGDHTPPMTAHVVVEGDFTVQIDEQFELKMTRRVK